MIRNSSVDKGFFFLVELSVTKVEIWRLYYQDKF